MTLEICTISCLNGVSFPRPLQHYIYADSLFLVLSKRSIISETTSTVKTELPAKKQMSKRSIISEATSTLYPDASSLVQMSKRSIISETTSTYDVSILKKANWSKRSIISETTSTVSPDTAEMVEKV